ncbi:MAG: hypothetical protein A2927_00235 [Candidatus Komeilibacteria bacterium RIFCSPLOWO2_01_FULL_45_10]|uniref:Lipoprotein n=1 Tax=Candidatus Komeilibacteria bacterium RIFCSPLOWO2_01_FULL_45_10 TaxID=1798550 RepID=A0A1G2BLU0_9BACT|nr:MAG: hypothetical protein A2927_00235 [Candidatus Komeilibacteria bacterium RIFCSPLOWO2_01_FULL_45_10]
MLQKTIVALLILLALTGCAGTINWRQYQPQPDYAKHGWQEEFYADYQNCQFIVSLGKSDQPLLAVDCFGPFYSENERLFVRFYPNGVINCDFISRKADELIPVSGEKLKQCWQASPIKNLLWQEKFLQKLPLPVQQQIKSALAAAEKKYGKQDYYR